MKNSFQYENIVILINRDKLKNINKMLKKVKKNHKNTYFMNIIKVLIIKII